MSTSNNKNPEESLLMRLGEFKASKVGNSWKVGIPKFVAVKWDLSGERAIEEQGSGASEEYEPNTLFLYSKKIHGRNCLVISNAPLPGDPILDDDW